MKTSTKKGAFFLITSAFFFALMSVFVRLSGNVPFFQKLLFRNGISFLVASFALLFGQKRFLRVPRDAALPLIVRILLGAVSVFCNYYAIDHLLLASSNSLSKLGPFFAVPIAALFLREHVSRTQLGIIGVALLGSLILIVPDMGTVGVASCIALLGGLANGGVHTALRGLNRGTGMDTAAVVFYFTSIFTAGVMIPCLIHWEPMTAKQFICLLLAGSSCAAAQFCFTTAYKYAETKDISVYDSFQIVFAAILGFLFFRQIPTALNFVAYALIILASVLLFFYHRRVTKTKESA